MDSVTTWSLILGFLSANFIIPLIQQPRWSGATRALITFAYSIVAGAVSVIAQGQFSWSNLGASIGVLLVTAIATYEGLAKKIGTAAAVENASTNWLASIKDFILRLTTRRAT